MRINVEKEQFCFKNQNTSKEKNKNAALAVCGGAVLLPLIPIIDGDNFKGTYRNKNTAKFVTGMAAIGGLIGGTSILRDKYFGSDHKTSFNTALFAATAPLMLFVNEWAEKSHKPIKKRWYFLSVIAGGAIGYTMSKILKQKLHKPIEEATATNVALSRV